MGIKKHRNKAKTSNKMKVSTYLSIIILNINGPHAPTERQSSWTDTKTEFRYMLLTRDSLKI